MHGKFTHPDLIRVTSMPGYKHGHSNADLAFGCVSLSENKARKMAETRPDKLAEVCLTEFRRAYPSGRRAAELKDRTGNLTEPTAMWAAGIQMVAFNFQTNDLPMQLNLALFRLNGGCGYVLKPAWMRRIHDDELARKRMLLVNGVPRALVLPTRLTRIELTILNAQFVPKPTDTRMHNELWMDDEECRQTRRGYPCSRDCPIDPAVVVSVHGGRFAGAASSVRAVKHQAVFETRTIRKNGLRPVWDETAVVLTSHPEVAILHIEIRDRSANIIGGGGVAGYAAIPVRALQDGKLRCVDLQDPHEKSAGARILFAHLMVGLSSCRMPTPPHVEAAFNITPEPTSKTIDDFEGIDTSSSRTPSLGAPTGSQGEPSNESWRHAPAAAVGTTAAVLGAVATPVVSAITVPFRVAGGLASGIASWIRSDYVSDAASQGAGESSDP